MKQTILCVTFLLFVFNLTGQAPPPVVTGLTDPGGLLRIGNDLYVSETGPNSRIIKVNLNDPMPATPTVVVSGGGITVPMGMVRKGNYIYFCQYGNGFVSRFNWTLASPVVENIVTSGLSNPTSIAINGNDMYVAQPIINTISKVDLTQAFPIAPSFYAGGVSQPWGLAIYGDTLLVSESGTPNIAGFDMTVVNPPRIAITTAGMNQPKGLSLDGNILYIADDDANNISKIDLTQSFPIVPEVVTSVLHPQDVLASGIDLFISELESDQVIRRLNTNALDPVIASNPSNKYYTGFYNPYSLILSHRSPGWNNPISWIPVGVPNPQSDIVALPVYGVDFTQNTKVRSVTCSSNAFINIHANFEVTEPSVFNAPCYINWVSGSITGNTTITNHGQMNFTTSDMYLIDSITLINYGGIRFESMGNLYMDQSTIHNKPSGEIKLDFPNTNIIGFGNGGAASRLIINEGIIRKTSAGTALISVKTENINGGIIQTETGNLEMAGNATLDNAIINIAPGTNLSWNYLSDVTLLGTLGGSLNGTMTFASGDIIVPGVATIDLTGNNQIGLYATEIIGGGVLNLKNNVSVFDGGFFKSRLRSGTTINNEKVFTIVAGDFAIRESTFNNLASGVIDIQSSNGILRFQSTTEKLNNYGLIKKSTSTSTANISTHLHNIGGTIQVERGGLNLGNNENLLEGGIYNVDSVDNILSLNYSARYLGDLTGTINGNILLKSHGLIVDSATTATLDFNGSGKIDCAGCVLSGKGSLINKSYIENTGLFLELDDGLTLINEGYIAGNINISGGDLYNTATGTLDLDKTSISSYNNNHTLYNRGLIKKSGPITNAAIYVPFQNLDGRIQVERGNLVIQNHSALLIDGQYDVDSSHNSLRFDHSVTCQGELNGQLNGPLLWDGYLNIDSAKTAIFNFNGNEGIDWISGSLTGGGTLVNKSTINLMSNNESNEGTTLNNEGQFNFNTQSQRLYLNNGIFNNMLSGVIDFQEDGTNFSHNSNYPNVINNMGLIKKSGSTGLSYVYLPVHNMGTMQVDSGTIRFTDTLYNHQNSIIGGIAAIDLPDAEKYINDGIYSPGASPGKLDVIGDFESTATSVLDIELDGLAQESEYDLIAVQGAADLKGTIDLTLGFDPSIGDTFTIMTSTNTLTSTLPSTIIATSPTNDVYTFDVQINVNSIVLEVLTDCQDYRVFNGDSLSGTYKAGLNITATNISVPATTVFSAPNVLFNGQVTVPSGQIFEINQSGCN